MMKKLLIFLSVLFTVIGTQAQNTDPTIFSYDSIAAAIKLKTTVGAKFTVKQKIGGFIYLNEYVVRPKSEGWAVNGGTIISMKDTNFVAIVNMANAQALNLMWFVAYNDSTHDATAGIKALRNYVTYSSAALVVFVPTGDFRITDSIVFRKTARIIGNDPVTSRILRDFISGGHGSLGSITFMSNDPAEKIKGIDIENLGFEGHADQLGHDQWGHELSFMGSDFATVRNCIFRNFRGDGLYLGAGLSSAPEDWRSNSNILVDKCSFDGGSKFRNRNGISIIDGDGITVTNSDFNHIGNDTLTRSVGCIDFERNRNTSYVRQSLIYNCRFTNSLSVNTSAVTFFTTVPEGLTNISGLLSINKCLFDSTWWGISANNYANYLTLTSEKTQIDISGNTFRNNRIAIRAAGNGISITKNTLKGGPNNLFTNIQIGFILGSNDIKAINVDCSYNTLDSTGQNAGIEMSNIQYATFDHNTIINRRSAFYFYADNLSNPDRKMSHLRFTNNTIAAPALADVNAGSLYMFNAPTGFDLSNFLINGTCEEYGNVLDNRVARATGVELYFNHSIVKAAPTRGTWNAGNELTSAAGPVGSYKLVCTAGGTYGVDTVTAGDTIHHSFLAKYYSNKLTVTNGENLFHSHLREGQYIKLTKGIGTFKIISIPDTATLFIDAVYNYYNGTDSTQIVDAGWSAPVFSSVPISYNWRVLDGTVHVKPGNTPQFIEYYATRQDTLYIDTDSSTNTDTRIHIRNVTPFNYSLVVIPDTGMKFNYSGLPITLHKNDELELLYKGSNTYRIWDNNQATLFSYLPGNDSAITYKQGNVYISPSTTVLPPPQALLNINVNNRLNSVPALMLANSNSGLGTGVQLNLRVGYDSNFISGQIEHRADTTPGSTNDMYLKVSNPGDSLFTMLALKGYGNVGIGKGFKYPDRSALLHLNSTTAGFIKPRMSTTQASAIFNKANGLEVFNTTVTRPAFYDSVNAIWKYAEDTAHTNATFIKVTDTGRAITQKTTGYDLNKVRDSMLTLLTRWTDTGRAVTQLATGGSLGKVKDSLAALITLASAGAGNVYGVQSSSIGALVASFPYYFGLNAASSAQTTAARNKVYVPRNCTIKSVYLTFLNGGTLATGESSSIYIRVNNTTDYLISSSVLNNAVFTEANNTALSISLNAGDYFEVKWLTAAWTTTPTNVRFTANIWAQ